MTRAEWESRAEQMLRATGRRLVQIAFEVRHELLASREVGRESKWTWDATGHFSHHPDTIMVWGSGSTPEESLVDLEHDISEKLHARTPPSDTEQMAAAEIDAET